MAKAKRKKPSSCPPHTLRLYKAVAHYIEKCGGSVVLAAVPHGKYNVGDKWEG